MTSRFGGPCAGAPSDAEAFSPVTAVQVDNAQAFL